MMTEKIYFLPGRGGHLHQGLGGALAARNYAVVGQELQGEFRRLRFREQISVVARELQTDFWHPGGKVVANSFGAYTLLHALASLAPFPGRLLLLSPIVGKAVCEEKMVAYVPPMAGQLQDLANNGTYPAPFSCEIHVGELDWQSNPENVRSLAGLIGSQVSLVPDAGHRLEPEYVSRVLDRWLPA